MAIYDSKLKDREEVAEGTMASHFEKPDGLSFKPGQALEIVLKDSPSGDAQNTRHAFSIVAAPFETHLTIATRMRDSIFKRTQKSLEMGSSIQLDGPFGSLTLHNNRARPAVLIAGGIGITPFMSILRQATHDELPQSLLLLYSNHRPEDAPFLTELQKLEQQNKRFRLIATMTRAIRRD